MTAPNRNLRFAYADYKSVPESMDKRYELLDGDLVLVPTPTIRHQRVSKKLGFILITFFEHNNLGEVLGAPLDVVFGKGDEREVVQPDIIFISNERKDIATEQEIQGAPDLVVEILSPGTEQRDRNYKKSLYSRYNVLEYWIVDPVAETIDIYNQTEQGLQRSGIYAAKQTVISPRWPELALEAGAIFASRQT